MSDLKLAHNPAHGFCCRQDFPKAIGTGLLDA
jgi:hypothetical protein